MRKLGKLLLVVAMIATLAAQASPALALIDMAICLANVNFTGIGEVSPNLMCNGWICEIDGIQYHIQPRTAVAVAGWAAAAAKGGKAKIIGHTGPMGSPCGEMVPIIFACKVVPI